MKFVFRIIYTPTLATVPKTHTPYSEQSDSLHIFLSGDLVREGKYGVTVVDVSRRSSKKLSIFIPDQTKFTDSSGIGVNAYCRTWAPQGYECKSTAGSGFLYIEEIAEVVSKYHSNSSGSRLAFDVALCEHTSTILVQGHKKPVIKGRVTFMLLLSESSLGKRIQIDPSPYSFLRRDRLEKVWKKRLLRLCQSNITEVNDLFLPSEPTELMASIRCAWYTTDTGLTLPGSCYVALRPRQHLSLQLFSWLLKISLQRHRLTPALLLARIGSDQLFFAEHGWQLFSSVTAHMLSALTWSLPYLTDFVNGNSSYPFKQSLLDNVYNEHYKNTLTVQEGDCDGLAWLTNLLTMEALFIDKTSRSGSSDDLYEATRRVLTLLRRYYVPFLVQGAATVGSSTDTKDADAQDMSLCCHTYHVLLPLFLVRQALERVPQKIPGIEKVKPHHPDGREAVLGVILQEGTGPCAPLQVQADDGQPTLHRYCSQVEQLESEYPVLTNLQRLMYRHHSGSGDGQNFSIFYRSAVTAYSDYFFQRWEIPSRDIVFVRVVQSSLTYGVTAKELFTRSPLLGLYLFNRLDQDLGEGVTLLDVTRGVMQRLEPVPLLLPPTPQQTEAVTQHVHQLLQSALYDHLPSRSSSGTRLHPFLRTVTYYCRLDNLTHELLHTLHQLYEKGAVLRHRVVPLATTELQLVSSSRFPLVSIDIEIDLAAFSH